MNEALLLENADADLWHVKYNHMIEDQFVMGCQQPFPTLYLLMSIKTLFIFPSISLSFTNKTDRHDTAEILLKVALNTIKPNLGQPFVRHSAIFFLTYCL
jgi:hypothetical protein